MKYFKHVTGKSYIPTVYAKGKVAHQRVDGLHTPGLIHPRTFKLMNPKWTKENPVTGDYCASYSNVQAHKKTLADCWDDRGIAAPKKDFVGRVIAGIVNGKETCKKLKAAGTCGLWAPVCQVDNKLQYGRGSMCSKSSGYGDCMTSCFQMALGAKIGGRAGGKGTADKAAAEWRCNSKAARGTTCRDAGQYLALCIFGICRDTKMNAMAALSPQTLMLGTASAWSQEVRLMKRTNSWSEFPVGYVGPVTTVPKSCTPRYPYNPKKLSPGARGFEFQYFNCVDKPRKVNAHVSFWFYLDAYKYMNCDRVGSMLADTQCRVKKKALVTTLCIKLEAGFDFWPRDPSKGWPGVARLWQDHDYRRQGGIIQVTPLICCRKADAACIKNKLAPQMRSVGKSGFADPRIWGSLATSELMAL